MKARSKAEPYHNAWHFGERVEVSGMTDFDLDPIVAAAIKPIRGWLEAANDNGLTVRMPRAHHGPNHEKPGDVLTFVAFPVEPDGKERLTTCTAITHWRGLSVGYLDPPWTSEARNTVEEARWFLGQAALPASVDLYVCERRHMRALSLAVPLRKAHVWNDHDPARKVMRQEAARLAKIERRSAPWPT